MENIQFIINVLFVIIATPWVIKKYKSPQEMTDEEIRVGLIFIGIEVGVSIIEIFKFI